MKRSIHYVDEFYDTSEGPLKLAPSEVFKIVQEVQKDALDSCELALMRMFAALGDPPFTKTSALEAIRALRGDM